MVGYTVETSDGLFTSHISQCWGQQCLNVRASISAIHHWPHHQSIMPLHTARMIKGRHGKCTSPFPVCVSPQLCRASLPRIGSHIIYRSPLKKWERKLKKVIDDLVWNETRVVYFCVMSISAIQYCSVSVRQVSCGYKHLCVINQLFIFKYVGLAALVFVLLGFMAW